MRKKILLSFLLFFCIFSPLLADAPSVSDIQVIRPIDSIQKDDCILILAPHPDDEAIGCAGIIHEAIAQGAKVKVCYLTNGDHNQLAFIVYKKRIPLRRNEFVYLGEVRRKEAIKAMKLLGVDEKNLIFLGYPDFGTFTIFKNFWQTKKPFKSWLTRISQVPYKENLSFSAPYTGESILSDLKSVILSYKPNKIFVSHPADGNVDHKSFYLFLQIALADLEGEIPKPKVYPYLIHCVGWPMPRHYHPELNLGPPKKFLNNQINWMKFELTPEQIEKKHQAVLCYKSQTASSAFYLLAFCRKDELFSDFAPIELSRHPAPESPEALISDYVVTDDSFLIRIKKPKKLKERFITQTYVFGYSYKKPFAQMPKIRIITKYDKFKIFDKKTLMKPEGNGVSLEFSPDALVLKLPLKILGEPDFILFSLKPYLGKAEQEFLPSEALGFRKIDLK
ncbi:MAG: PIG-L family deacetylase [Candidatus Omnitrophota bacterium]|nr:PIG-L family deacetylase [Candidatus Omnitrophota bacterium]